MNACPECAIVNHPQGYSNESGLCFDCVWGPKSEQLAASNPKPAAPTVEAQSAWTDAQMIEFASFCVYAVSLKDKSLGERLEVFRDREKVRAATPPVGDPK